MKSAYDKVCGDYPRQCAAMRKGLEALGGLEREKIEDPDAAAACFGALLGELFVWREDRWSDTLRRMGDALGRALNEQRFRAILQMLMGDCVLAFDRLPLVQDAGLLKHILCLGFWTQFDRLYQAKKEEKDD